MASVLGASAVRFKSAAELLLLGSKFTQKGRKDGKKRQKSDSDSIENLDEIVREGVGQNLKQTD